MATSLINLFRSFVGLKKKKAKFLALGRLWDRELNEAVPALQKHTVWQADNYRTGDKWTYRGHEITEGRNSNRHPQYLPHVLRLIILKNFFF